MHVEPSTPHIWVIVEHFYRSRRIYKDEHDNYERQVHDYVEQLGLPREQIRLGPEELSRLLHFKELETVRDDHLLPLKDGSHSLFRGDDSTDFLDRLLNDIFHEISILKEEHYNVLTYDPAAPDIDWEELNTILDEVHEMFPIKVHRLKHLFEMATARLERILPHYKDNTVLVRSLFLHRDDFVAEAYDEGLLRFYQLLYGEPKAVNGFQVVGDSFYHAGFYQEAMECFSAGEAHLQGIPPAAKRRLDPSWKQARDHFKRYRRLCQDRMAQLEE
ncbi:MAG: hypothetical protein AAF581_02655 [Planctomycetota bacterium]